MTRTAPIWPAYYRIGALADGRRQPYLNSPMVLDIGYLLDQQRATKIDGAKLEIAGGLLEHQRH
jgi:hypothetical protein